MIVMEGGGWGDAKEHGGGKTVSPEDFRRCDTEFAGDIVEGGDDQVVQVCRPEPDGAFGNIL